MKIKNSQIVKKNIFQKHFEIYKHKTCDLQSCSFQVTEGLLSRPT